LFENLFVFDAGCLERVAKQVQPGQNSPQCSDEGRLMRSKVLLGMFRVILIVNLVGSVPGVIALLEKDAVVGPHAVL
jgi:hypothetical protein